MVMINLSNLRDILNKKGGKLCCGLKGEKCWKPRREKGRLCSDCHRNYMREYMKSKSKVRVREEDGYDFNQDVNFEYKMPEEINLGGQ